MINKTPGHTQARLLRTLLRRAASTKWGHRLKFADIARTKDVIAAYQERVPLHSYDDIREDINHIRAGARDVMWPGIIRYFAISSGTTSSGKIIPVSLDTLRKNKRFVVRTGLQYLKETHNLRFLWGKHLVLPGRIENDPNFSGTLIGEISGLQTAFAPIYFKYLLQAIPNQIAFLPNWQKKLEAIVARAMDMNIRMVTMAPTWALVIFQLLIKRYNEKYDLQARTVGDIWPNLQLFISGAVALSSYRSILENIIGLPHLHFLEVYGASEGFFAHQNDLNDPAMALRPDSGVFYEFVPEHDLDSASPSRLTLSTVEPNVRYAVVVTTCSGLWAYNLGDVVRFTQTSPPMIVVAGRTGEMIDTYGEAVTGEDAASAMEKACRATGARMLNFHVTSVKASVNRMPTLQWLVEFDRKPDDIQAFAHIIDVHLNVTNRHYQIRRGAGAYAPPVVTALPQGTFHSWLKSHKKRISGQTKVPRMSTERDIADAILAHAHICSAD